LSVYTAYSRNCSYTAYNNEGLNYHSEMNEISSHSQFRAYIFCRDTLSVFRQVHTVNRTHRHCKTTLNGTVYFSTIDGQNNYETGRRAENFEVRVAPCDCRVG
jgi:hypothetical protein